MKVRDIMTSEGLATASLDTTLAEIAVRMRDESIGAIPIVDEDDNLAGIITDRDIVVRAIAEGEDPEECTAEEILSEQLHTVHPDADLEDAADLMARQQIRRLPVVEDEVIVGMISLGDLAVKSEEDEAAEVLEEVSSGVRESGKSQGRGKEVAGRQSPGERVASDETENQRQSNRQSGGTRSENANAARARNQSRSQQTIANEIVDVEGEEEPEFENAGAGNARQRANQQTSTRGRQNASARGRESGQVRGESARGGGSSRTQGASNRSQREENRRQVKVTPIRAEASNSGRQRGKKRAG